jgi:hypothetical protein
LNAAISSSRLKAWLVTPKLEHVLSTFVERQNLLMTVRSPSGLCSGTSTVPVSAIVRITPP